MLNRQHLSVFVLVLLATRAPAQTTWYVSVSGSPGAAGTAGDPYESLGAAIAAPTTNQGDMIIVLPGTYFESVDFGGKAVAIVSQAGADATIIDGGGGGPVVQLANGEGPGSALIGLTITGGASASGAGIRCVGSSPLISDCIVRDNVARPGSGGGVSCTQGSAPTFEDCVFRQNLAWEGGAVYAADSVLTLLRCTFDQNAAEDPLLAAQPSDTFKGGGVFVSNSTLSVTECSFVGNRARCGDGGGIYLEGSIADIQETLFEVNSVGAAFVECVDALVRGGALCVDANSTAGVLGCDFIFNRGLYGAAFAFNNTQALGGAVWGAATIWESTFERNFVEGVGGATFDADLTDCVLTGNNAIPNLDDKGGNGGAVRGGTHLRCTISNSWAADLGGGALIANLVECRLEGNRGGQGGGASLAQLTRCVVFDNEADAGGGVRNCDLSHCTVFGNTALFSGGGVSATSGTIVSSIVWGNVPDQIGPVLVPTTYSDVQGGYVGLGNFDADPGFWGPASGDFQLLSGSPCIDAGDPTSPVDPDGSIVDVGALTFDSGYVGAPGTYCTAKEASSGCLPAIGFVGSPTLSGPDDFHVTVASVVDGEFGILFWGLLPGAVPFLGGTRCVLGSVQRTPAMASGGSSAPGSDCSGTFDFHFSQAYTTDQSLGAGDRRYAQMWFRDPEAEDGTSVGMSDALEFTLLP